MLLDKLVEGLPETVFQLVFQREMGLGFFLVVVEEVDSTLFETTLQFLHLKVFNLDGAKVLLEFDLGEILFDDCSGNLFRSLLVLKQGLLERSFEEQTQKSVAASSTKLEVPFASISEKACVIHDDHQLLLLAFLYLELYEGKYHGPQVFLLLFGKLIFFSLGTGTATRYVLIVDFPVLLQVVEFQVQDFAFGEGLL